jgi:enamine deaminase RidA (YjgF/YER057c/UK114 family)
VLEFINPPTVHAPLGLYSHTVIVPGGTELVYLSGQLGVPINFARILPRNYHPQPPPAYPLRIVNRHR